MTDTAANFFALCCCWVSFRANSAHGHGDYVHRHPHGHGPDDHDHAGDRTPLALLDRSWLGGLPHY
jgi:hypothetical protein